MAGNSGTQSELELRYAWDWFHYHARQRLMSFNFFLILTSAIIVGYANALASHSRVLGIAVAFIGAVVAVGFTAMDVRNTELVQYGRNALKALEDDGELPRAKLRSGDIERGALKDALSPLPHREQFCTWLDKKDRRLDLITHGFWLRSIMGMIGAMFLAGGVWAATGY